MMPYPPPDPLRPYRLELNLLEVSSLVAVLNDALDDADGMNKFTYQVILERIGESVETVRGGDGRA